MKSILRIGWSCWRSRWRRRRGCSFVVDEVLQFLTWLEVGNPLGRNLDLFPRFRIAADASVALAHAEAAETAHFEFVAGFQRLDNAFKQSIDNDLRIFPCQLCNPGNFFHEVCFRHLLTPPLVMTGARSSNRLPVFTSTS